MQYFGLTTTCCNSGCGGINTLTGNNGTHCCKKVKQSPNKIILQVRVYITKYGITLVKAFTFKSAGNIPNFQIIVQEILGYFSNLPAYYVGKSESGEGKFPEQETSYIHM